ncbi:hypothetical protein ACLQ24_30105, partial [Micromonospora sp. DT4]|uniref:hypothetical protein n=1 Tax=Micromonospora sp. DT4 TaxID=3393438 RepID=UPI003CEC34EA
MTGSVLTDVLTDPAHTSTPGMMAASTGPHRRAVTEEMRVSNMVGALIDWYDDHPDMRGRFPVIHLSHRVPGTAKIVYIGAWVHRIRSKGIDDPTGLIAAAMEECGITVVPAGDGRRITTLKAKSFVLIQPHRHHEFRDAATRTATIRSDPKDRLLRKPAKGHRHGDLIRILKIWVAENPSHL